MSVIWSGVTEEGAVVPVQVTDEGKVVAVGDGPQGDYLPITGGELTGDLDVDGSITAADGSFAGDVKVGDYDLVDSNGRGVFLTEQGQIISQQRSASAAAISVMYQSDATPRVEIKGDGQSYFRRSMVLGTYDLASVDKSGISLIDSGKVYIQGNGSYVNSESAFQVLKGTTKKIEFTLGGSATFAGNVTSNGSATFANGSCGFTSAGEIFFTSRGSRYKLFVSNGMVQAEEYTRQMELKEKAEEFIADKRETKPSDPQVEVTPDNDNA